MNTGDYAGGIRTVQDLMDRCVVDEFCDCWRYKGAKQNGLPKIHFRFPGGKQQVARGRRAAMCVVHGKDVPAGMVVYAKPQCEFIDCVNPAHCIVGTRAERGRAQRGKPVSLRKIQANTANGMKRSKLTPEIAREIRNSSKTLGELALEYGVVMSRIGAIKLGQAWKETANGASVFTWRP